MANESIARPALRYLALEARAGLEFSLCLASLPLLQFGPRGDGHPVLVLPGFTAGDISTLTLRRFLRRRGYHVHGWLLGRNMGPTTAVQNGLRDRFHEIHLRHGQKVSLIGWSLGGIYAREIARALPDDVRQVITLASPFRNPVASNVAVRARRAPTQESDADVFARLRTPLQVPSTAIYTRTDGIVAWKSCLETPGAQRQNIEVQSSHCGMGHHPRVLQIIADRLSQPEGDWAPYTSLH